MTSAQAQSRIKAADAGIHAFLQVFETEDDRAEPIAVKDLICTTEGYTTAASHMLAKFRSPIEATVITRLKEAGYAVIGKTNLDEFAMGASTEYSAFGVTKNPWDPSRVAGGSSGGSAAAVAAGMVELALGTDTGGSVRQPASLCGVVGVRPTYGRVSRFGVIAYGSSLDQVGPITRTVKDSAKLLEIIAGHDSRDATTSEQPVPSYTRACGQDVAGLKIGVPKEHFAEGVDKQVASTVRDAIAKLASLGATIKEISLPLTDAAVPVYYLIAKAEASTNLARFDSLRYSPLELDAETLIDHYIEARGQGFGPEVKRAILMGTYALSAGYVDAWYKQASKVRSLIRQDFMRAFEQVDLIASPTSPELAFTIGAKADDPLAMYLADALTVPQSVAGLPAISIPCGFASDASTQRSPKGESKPASAELPVGLQLTAPPFQEETIFQAAHAYEQASDWHKQNPPIAA